MSKSKTIDNFIEELIQEVEEELEEATTTGDAAGYDTPHAFSRKDKKSKKKTKDVATQAGYEVVNEVAEKDFTNFWNEHEKWLKANKYPSFKKQVANLVSLAPKYDIDPTTVKKVAKTFDSWSKRTYGNVPDWTGWLKGKLVNEAYDGNLSDFKTDFEMATDDLFGIGPKAIKKITKKGNKYEVRMSTYMKDKSRWERIGDEIGAKLVDFKPGFVNVGLYESKYKAMIAQDVIETIFKKELSRKFDVIRIDVDHQSGQTEWFKIYLEKKQDPQPIIDYLKRNYGISSKIDRGTRNNVIQLSGNQLVEGKKSNKPRNRWLELKNDDSKTPHKKLAVGLKELKYQLREVEKFLGWYNKIKSMNELETDGYWKRTNKNIRNIKERIINIAQKLKELEQ